MTSSSRVIPALPPELLEDKSASAAGHALDLGTYLHQRLFESSRFSLETLQRVLEHSEESQTHAETKERYPKIAKCQTVNELAELFNLSSDSSLKLGFKEEKCMDLISRATTLELSNWIVHVSQGFSDGSHALVVRADGSISFFVKVAYGHEISSLIDSVKLKEFMRKHSSLYLKLRQWVTTVTAPKKHHPIQELEAKAIEIRLKDVQNMRGANDYSLQSGLPDFLNDPEERRVETQ